MGTAAELGSFSHGSFGILGSTQAPVGSPFGPTPPPGAAKGLLEVQGDHPMSGGKLSVPSTEVRHLMWKSRRRQLYCATGFNLEIRADGTVGGTREDYSRYAILNFVSVAIGLVIIRGMESNMYLRMNSDGQLSGSETVTDECVFKETVEENWYNTYSSARFRHGKSGNFYYLGLNRDGTARDGSKTKRHQRFSHFLPRHVDDNIIPDLTRTR